MLTSSQGKKETQTKQRKRLAGKANSAHPAKSQWVELCSQFTVVKAGRDDRKTKTVTQTQIVTDFLSLGVK